MVITHLEKSYKIHYNSDKGRHDYGQDDESDADACCDKEAAAPLVVDVIGVLGLVSKKLLPAARQSHCWQSWK